MASLPSLSQAALTVTSVSNTASTYNATLDWSASSAPFTIDSLACGTAAPVLSLGCTPWLPLQLQAFQFSGFPALGQVSLALEHVVGPHIVDNNPGVAGGLLVTGVAPGLGSGFITVYATHNPHFDRLTLSVDAISAGLSRITIAGDHSEVPEPSTLALGALGGSGLLFLKRLRRRNS